ncbi:hypothetical protein B1757_11510 [Acidithiobacillus marinus]|uniref:BrnA antitoxin family protein n=1 Tax=Acidithiobacillus marinus TaxID=187490 RepID=A0A2I1DJN0_9PROT|nr:hypothetical protein B1757_11510 [Acidithiobacillus marinus]
MPTATEDAAIQDGISRDIDTYELPLAEFETLKRMGRPPAAVTKERVSIRLSREVVSRFRASGPGWQTRLDAALKEWLEAHPQL